MVRKRLYEIFAGKAPGADENEMVLPMNINLSKKSIRYLAIAALLLALAFVSREEFVVEGETLTVNNTTWWGLGQTESKSIPIPEIEQIDISLSSRHGCRLFIRSRGCRWYTSHKYMTRGDFRKLIKRVKNPDGTSMTVTYHVWLEMLGILAGVILAGPFARSLKET